MIGKVGRGWDWQHISVLSIVVGDWNDQLQDTGIYQSFSPFINDKENFLFATGRIVSDPNQQSYPTWPSFLDHIMIGRGYFEVFENKGQISL